MSVSLKALLITALLPLMTGHTSAAGFNSLQFGSSACVSATDTEKANLDENGNPIVLPDDDEEEDEEPDCE